MLVCQIACAFLVTRRPVQDREHLDEHEPYGRETCAYNAKANLYC